MKQLNLFSEKSHTEMRSKFGGSLLKGKRKGRRPILVKVPTHLVLKAINSSTLLNHRDEIEHKIRKYCEQFGITVYALAVHADHIHMLLKFPDRESYIKWIRALTGLLTRLIPDLQWRLRPFTRPVRWGLDFTRVSNYLELNNREANFMLHAHLCVNGLRRAMEREFAQGLGA